MAGAVGGRTLQVPTGPTRPTSERVREALFSRLEHLGAVDGAHVLDLYAGSGALGLEAVSRGAAGAVLVDSDRRAVQACRANVRRLGLRSVQVVAETVEAYLRRAPQPAAGLVLVDPPYDITEDALAAVLAALDAPGVLAPDAVVVVERSVRSPRPRWPERWEALGERRYGETVVWFLAVPAPGAAPPAGADRADIP